MKKNKSEKWSIFTNLVVSLLIFLFALFSYFNESILGLSNNLFLLLFLFNLIVFVYSLAKKQRIIMKTIFLLFSLTIPIISFLIPQKVNSISGIITTFLIGYGLLFLISLYYLWRE